MTIILVVNHDFWVVLPPLATFLRILSSCSVIRVHVPSYDRRHLSQLTFRVRGQWVIAKIDGATRQVTMCTPEVCPPVSDPGDTY